MIWRWARILREAGIVGMNERNANYVSQYNPRRLYPLVDDKLRTKQLAIAASIAVPPLYGVVESEHQAGEFLDIIKDHSTFVIKPAQGSGGDGILVIRDRRGPAWVKANGTLIGAGEIRHHISNILSGMFSLGGTPDKAMIEYCVQFDPVFERISFQGVPDIRTLVFRGVPIAAMARLPTRDSDGKANLHQGAIGVGIDLKTGMTMGGVWRNSPVAMHPDTGEPLTGVRIPGWDKLLNFSTRCYDLCKLGYLGVDVVLDRELGPLVLELNARPGLSIQLANERGLGKNLKRIEKLDKIPADAQDRVELALQGYASQSNPNLTSEKSETAKTRPMDKQAQFSGTGAVREQHQFDETALLEWLKTHVEGFEGPLTVEQFKGGQSNPTYKLITPGQKYVLRRKPPGKLLASAHAVDREYRVITALGTTGFPVAKTFGLCTDESVIGTWFYVMECVEGRIIWDTSFPDIDISQRAAYFDAMNETMARLHSVDYAALGLEDFGKTGNYFERQIKRWSRQYREDVEAGQVTAMDKLVAWLPENIPDGDESTIVHGDYRCDNMIFHPTEPRVLAVLDWELSTLGHPLADFSYHLMMYRMPPGVTAGLVGTDLKKAGIPSESEYVASYCQRTGRTIPDNIDFYIAFNMFRLAAILHGIRGRVARGTAASAHAKEMASHVEALAELGWKQAQIGNS